mgnify:CR=1 FL=1
MIVFCHPFLEPLQWKKLAYINMARWVVFDGQPHTKNAGQPHKNVSFMTEGITIFTGQIDLKALIAQQLKKIEL